MKLEQRKEKFPQFYEELIPSLVDFVEKVGVSPGHAVLKQAVDYAPLLNIALGHLEVNSQEDRVFLVSRVGYFIGEYFSQKYSGAWYVNEIEGSRYFGRYVVGRFPLALNSNVMIDPFEAAQGYAEQATPRDLLGLLSMVDNELKQYFQPN